MARFASTTKVSVEQTRTEIERTLSRYGATAFAEKITKKAEEALDGLTFEMVMMKWPPEFRAIMWGAVADIAFKRKVEAEQQR